jgi:hypothetical protein
VLPKSLQTNKASIKRWWYQPSRRRRHKKSNSLKRKEKEDEKKGNGRNTIHSRFTPRIATRASRGKKRKYLKEREGRERSKKSEMLEHCGAKKHSQEQGIPDYGDPDEGHGQEGYMDTAQIQWDMGIVFQSTPRLGVD